MMRLAFRLFVYVLFVLVGLYVGAKWGAPEIFVSTIDGIGQKASELIGNEPTDDAEDEDDESAASGPSSETSANAGDRIWEGTEAQLILCATNVQNAPASDAQGQVLAFKKRKTVEVDGVSLSLKPATKSCFSSGFGQRNGKLHKGVDYFSDRGGDVLAAGDGVIVEALFRNDYGNMVIVDHGNGVYTRYAHLAKLGSGVSEGASVSGGDVLGPIGKTGATGTLHLHFEVLTGDYHTNAKSFGLKPLDPFGSLSADATEAVEEATDPEGGILAMTGRAVAETFNFVASFVPDAIPGFGRGADPTEDFDAYDDFENDYSGKVTQYRSELVAEEEATSLDSVDDYENDFSGKITDYGHHLKPGFDAYDDFENDYAGKITDYRPSSAATTTEKGEDFDAVDDFENDYSGVITDYGHHLAEKPDEDIFYD